MTSLGSDLYTTYSIVARDQETGQLGVAVQTHQMCVGAVVPWLSAGVGAIASQASSNMSFGSVGLTMLTAGMTAPRVVDALVASDAKAARRQLAVVDSHGRSAAWTGGRCLRKASHQVGAGYSVQANMMLTATVVPAMAAAYEDASGDLAQRLMVALEAAQREGGDIRGTQSAAIRVVSGDASEHSWSSVYDLRVDEHENPLEELSRLVRLRRARHLDSRGHALFDKGKRADALDVWKVARAQAPELEELAFWQAVALADRGSNVSLAAEILHPMLESEELHDRWIELLRRVGESGMIERQGAGDDLLSALGYGSSSD